MSKYTTTTGIGIIRLPHARRLECELAELAGDPCPPSPVRETLATLRSVLNWHNVSCVLCISHLSYEYIVLPLLGSLM